MYVGIVEAAIPRSVGALFTYPSYAGRMSTAEAVLERFFAQGRDRAAHLDEDYQVKDAANTNTTECTALSTITVGTA